MINKRIKCKKLFDYIDVRNTEVLLSIFVTIAIFFVLLFINIYSNFYVLTGNICDFILCIIGALIGVLGVLLAGVAFIAGLFTPEYIEALTYGLKISKEKRRKVRTNKGRQVECETGEEIMDMLMGSFVFLSLHIGLYIVYLISIYFLINSSIEIISKAPFYILLFISLYMLVFTLFYTIALVYNCIELNIIKNRFYNSYKKEKSFFDKANEIRIDMIIATILSEYEGDKETKVLNALKEVTNKSNYSDIEKVELLRYFEQVYGR